MSEFSTIFLPPCQSTCQLVCDTLLSLNIQVSINVGGHFDVGVSQPFLHIL